MAKPTEVLIERLWNAGVDLPTDCQILRSYAGRDQRQKGAWSWYCFTGGTGARSLIGSYSTVTVLLKAPRLMCLWDGTVAMYDPSYVSQHGIRWAEAEVQEGGAA